MLELKLIQVSKKGYMKDGTVWHAVHVSSAVDHDVNIRNM